MKNIYLFLVLLLIIGCGFNPLSKTSTVPIPCPSVLFASEHKTYVGSLSELITLDNIAYQAEINNVLFTKGCFLKDNKFSSNLSLLFIVSPLEESQNMINLPFYVAVINASKEVKDIQYYSINDVFQKNLETNELIETEITKTILINLPSMDESSLVVIGFMLDKSRLEILN